MARVILVLFHVGGDLVVLKGLSLLLWPISLAPLCGRPESRTSPVLEAVFVPQMRVFDVELARTLVRSHGQRKWVTEYSKKHS